MILRKFITILKFIELHFCNVKIKKTIHSNIERNVRVYNKGNKIEIGETYIRSNTCINTEGDGELFIGDKVFINRNCIISSRYKTIIKEYSIIGPNVCIYDHDHNFGKNGVEKGFKLDEVVIEKNCWIGAGTIVLKGTHLGENCVVAAGTILKGEYPPNSIIYNKRATITKELALKEQNDGEHKE